jgi:Zn-dependent protease
MADPAYPAADHRLGSAGPERSEPPTVPGLTAPPAPPEKRPDPGPRRVQRWRRGPPRWTFSLFGTVVRMSVGLAACVVAAAGVLLWSPDGLPPWVPLALVATSALSTLAHEGAHAWVAHLLGYRVEWVLLGGLVGVTAFEGRDDRPLDRAAVSLAGPAATAALVLVLVGVRAVLAPSPGMTVATEVAIAFNAVALIANLVPVGGTDGAQCARALMQHRRGAGRRRAPAPAAATVGPSG